VGALGEALVGPLSEHTNGHEPLIATLTSFCMNALTTDH
jgi:hypothetical protein